MSKNSETGAHKALSDTARHKWLIVWQCPNCHTRMTEMEYLTIKLDACPMCDTPLADFERKYL